MQEVLFKIRYFERGLSKSLKKLTLFFLSNPVPFNGKSYQKQKGSGTSNQLLLRLRNNFKNILLFVIYYLTYIFILYYYIIKGTWNRTYSSLGKHWKMRFLQLFYVWFFPSKALFPKLVWFAIIESINWSQYLMEFILIRLFSN